jgi:type IV pilus biogenesis protein CpaD/CtpE
VWRVVAVIVALSIGGCGQSDVEQVQSVFKQYAQASAASDHHKFCSLLTPEQRADVSGSGSSVASCAAARARRAHEVTERGRRNAKRIRIVDVEVHGDTATASARIGECTLTASSARFHRVDEEWLFDGFEPTSRDDEPRCR